MLGIDGSSHFLAESLEKLSLHRLESGSVCCCWTGLVLFAALPAYSVLSDGFLSNGQTSWTPPAISLLPDKGLNIQQTVYPAPETLNIYNSVGLKHIWISLTFSIELKHLNQAICVLNTRWQHCNKEQNAKTDLTVCEVTIGLLF